MLRIGDRGEQLLEYGLGVPEKYLGEERTTAVVRLYNVLGRLKLSLTAERLEETVAAIEQYFLAESQAAELARLCPFDHGGHQDSQPSLWVNTRHQRWGCYAPAYESNVGGERAHDVVNYRALSHGLSNREAIRQLANELLLSA